jgi:hypothetical protein
VTLEFGSPLGDPGDLPVWVAFDLPSFVVDQPVVEAAEGDQVVQVGWSTVCPVFEMVDLEP